MQYSLKKKPKRSEAMRWSLGRTKWMFRGILFLGILLVGIATWLSTRLWIQPIEQAPSTNKSSWTVDDVGRSNTITTTKTAQHPLQCLRHEPVWVNASRVTINNQTKRLEPFTLLQMSMPDGCGPLKRDWRDNPPLSPLAQRMLQHQSNCSLPVATFYLDNLFGIGSHIALWSQAMCHAWDQRVRLRTDNPTWLWLDQYHCNVPQHAAQQASPWLCYFPKAEFLCGNEPVWRPQWNVSDPRNKKATCSYMKQGGSLSAFRAATTEYLFRAISPLVLQEAQRQIGVLFGPNGAPDDLITVHIRWGDKFFEMKLAIIDEYLHAISKMLIDELGRPDNTTANIYLATEDPLAVRDFMAAAPPGWKIYIDRTVEELNPFRPSKGNRASWTAKNTNGRAGLLGLASLLVSMEANYFILTTGSNWSRLMNHLRTNIIDPRCHNCTKMIDLRPGLW